MSDIRSSQAEWNHRQSSLGFSQFSAYSGYPVFQHTPEKVGDEAHFAYDLGLGWLDQIELMTLIEEEFPSWNFPTSDVKQIETVGDLIRHVERELCKKHKDAA